MHVVLPWPRRLPGPCRPLAPRDLPWPLLSHPCGQTRALDSVLLALFFERQNLSNGERVGQSFNFEAFHDFSFKSLGILLNKLQHTRRLSDWGKEGERRERRADGNLRLRE